MRGCCALTEDHLLRFGAALTSLIFLAAGMLAADLAQAHMAVLGTICGDAGSAPHCGLCLGAAGLALAGLAAFSVALAGPRRVSRRVVA